MVTARTSASKATNRTPKKNSSSRRGPARANLAARVAARVIRSRAFRNRSLRRLVVTGAVAGFLLAVFTVPVKNWWLQDRALSAKQAEFDALADANEQLQSEVNKLQTPEGVRAAARDQLGYVVPGESRIRLLDGAALPRTLPNQWPYTMVSGIVAVRQSIAQADNAPLSPLSP